MFAEAQAASPRPWTEKTREGGGEAVERSRGEGERGIALGPWVAGEGKGSRGAHEVSGVLNLGDWQAGPNLVGGGGEAGEGSSRSIFQPLLGAPGPWIPTWRFRTTAPPASAPTPPASNYAMNELPLEAQQTLTRAERRELGRCYSTDRDLCEGVGDGRRPWGEDARRHRRWVAGGVGRDYAVRAAEVRGCLAPGSAWVSAFPGRGPVVPGGSGRCRRGLSSSGQGRPATAAALAREEARRSSWTEFCELGEKPEFPSWPPGPHFPPHLTLA